MLTEVSNGAPPANSPPVSVIAVPGSAYHYSGGSYEIVEALMQDATGKPFPRLMQDLLLDPIGMTASSFEQPPSAALASRGGTLVDADRLGQTPCAACRYLAGPGPDLPSPPPCRMLTPQNGGPYGLGAGVTGDGSSLVLMKRGQNVGYQGYLILYPASGQGLVVMSDSDNGSKRRAD